MSFVHRAGPYPSTRSRVARVEPAADRLDDERLGLVELGRRRAGSDVEDPAGQHLLDRAVERQRGELAA